MSNENVIHLAFRKPESTEMEYTDYIACKHCKNKTYTLTENAPNTFPLLKCAACGAHIGRIGWTND